MSTTITTKIPEMHKPATLYEMIQLNNYNGVDIYDDTWDLAVFLECPENWEAATDNYDKLMLLFALNLRTVFETRPADEQNDPLDTSSVCCAIGTFLWEHRDVFDPFFNAHNRAGYRPKDYADLDPDKDSGFYSAYMMPFESLVVGNYSDKDYGELYDALLKSSEPAEISEKS